jgi:hypothetical protein
MTTSTLDGAQPLVSLNRTENLIVVAGDPEPGDAVPPLSAGFVAPLQLAAASAEVDIAGSMRTTMATATAKTAVLAVRSRYGRR